MRHPGKLKDIGRAALKHFYSALTFALLVFEVSAAPRLEIVATVGGQRAAGVEACVSRAKPGEGVISQMISGPEIRCLPADRILSLPQGTWHAWLVKTEANLISTHPLKFVLPSGSDENEPAWRLRAELVPAARLGLEKLGARRNDHALNIYVVNQNAPPAIIPVLEGSESVLVPAGVPVRVLETRGEAITRVGRETRVSDHGAAEWLDTPMVVIPVTTAGVPLVERTLPSLSVVARASGDVARQFDLSREANGLLFLDPAELRDGAYDVQSDDDGWLAIGRPIVVDRTEGGVRVAPDIRLQRAVATARIEWSVDPALLSRVADCGSDREASPARLRMLLCPATVEAIDRVGERACSVIRQAGIDEPSGNVSWPIPASAGEVWVAIGAGPLTTSTRIVTSQNESRADLRLFPRSIRGGVRAGTRPLQATVVCGSFAVIADAQDGSFACPLRENVTFPMALRVIPCDGSQEYAHVIDTGDAADRRVEITLPDNSVTVQVVDSEGTLLEGANVYSYFGREQGELGPTRQLGSTGKDGVIRSDRFAPGALMTVCAGKRGYLRACRDDIQLTASEDRAIDLTLRREPMLSGRVVSSSALVDGELFAVADGKVLARARIAADGTFEIGSAPPQSHFIVTAASHPLAILDQSSADPFVLTFPSIVEVRDFTVEAADAGTVTLILNDVLIPVNVFLRHQMRFRESHYVRPDMPIRIRRVNTFGTVVVVLGPANADAFADVRVLPALPKRVLGRDATVTFQ